MSYITDWTTSECSLVVTSESLQRFASAVTGQPFGASTDGTFEFPTSRQGWCSGRVEEDGAHIQTLILKGAGSDDAYSDLTLLKKIEGTIVARLWWNDRKVWEELVF
ncbi:MAG: hypothetical protein KDD70_06480 [Bdellovibrionales bacterium]|nr:hypothetical protein [Bdellovibrionales bacterium]